MPFDVSKSPYMFLNSDSALRYGQGEGQMMQGRLFRPKTSRSFHRRARSVVSGNWCIRQQGQVEQAVRVRRKNRQMHAAVGWGSRHHTNSQFIFALFKPD